MLSGYVGYGAADEGCAVFLDGRKTQGAHERPGAFRIPIVVGGDYGR